MAKKEFYEWWKSKPKKQRQKISGEFGILKFIGMKGKQAESQIRKMWK
jgi:hypothetical protein